MAYYRTCAGAAFNSGVSKCPLDPAHIKAIVLTQRGYKLPATLTASALEASAHAARPARIYPIKTVVEYASSGGEAQTVANGYGPTHFTGYSSKTDTFTIDAFDANLRAAIVNAKGVPFDAYLIDDQNVIYGYNDGTSVMAGIPLAGIYVGGQDFDSSGSEANLTVTLLYSDYEMWMKNAGYEQVDFDIIDALQGLVFVDLVEDGGTYSLIEHYSGLDITSYYGDLLATAGGTAVLGASAVTYSSSTNRLTITGTVTGLAEPSVLLGAGIIGIEGW